MQVHRFEDKGEWEKFRKGRITGTRLDGITVKRGTGKKIAYYELIAERMGIYETDENAMERGLRLEPEAIALYQKQSGLHLDTSLAIWTSEFNENISVSPDAFTPDLKQAVEVKCLSAARHIQALIEGEFPDEYELQTRQYFVVNPKLETLHFVMYDPRIAARPLVVFDIHRADIEPKVQESLAYELQTLKEVDEWVAKLSNF